MMNNFIQDISAYINQNGLINQAHKDLGMAFNNWKEGKLEEDLGIFKDKGLEDMNLFVEEVSVRASEWPECERQHIVIKIVIYDGNSYMGDYHRLYPISKDTDGDDFFGILTNLSK